MKNSSIHCTNSFNILSGQNNEWRDEFFILTIIIILHGPFLFCFFRFFSGGLLNVVCLNASAAADCCAFFIDAPLPEKICKGIDNWSNYRIIFNLCTGPNSIQKEPYNKEQRNERVSASPSIVDYSIMISDSEWWFPSNDDDRSISTP